MLIICHVSPLIETCHLLLCRWRHTKAHQIFRAGFPWLTGGKDRIMLPSMVKYTPGSPLSALSIIDLLSLSGCIFNTQASFHSRISFCSWKNVHWLLFFPLWISRYSFPLPLFYNLQAAYHPLLTATCFLLAPNVGQIALPEFKRRNYWWCSVTHRFYMQPASFPQCCTFGKGFTYILSTYRLSYTTRGLHGYT